MEVDVEELDLDSDFKLDRHLKKYSDAHCDAMKGSLFHSFTCDKSRVGSQGLQNGFTCIPTSHGVWAPPQASYVELHMRCLSLMS